MGELCLEEKKGEGVAERAFPARCLEERSKEMEGYLGVHPKGHYLIDRCMFTEIEK